MNAKVVWHRKEDRPATFEEIKQLEEDKDLVINYYNSKRTNTGLVWVDLTDKAERTFELRDE